MNNISIMSQEQQQPLTVEKKRVRRGGLKQRQRKERHALLDYLQRIHDNLPSNVSLTSLLRELLPPLGPDGKPLPPPPEPVHSDGSRPESPTHDDDSDNEHDNASDDASDDGSEGRDGDEKKGRRGGSKQRWRKERHALLSYMRAVQESLPKGGVSITELLQKLLGESVIPNTLTPMPQVVMTPEMIQQQQLLQLNMAALNNLNVMGATNGAFVNHLALGARNLPLAASAPVPYGGFVPNLAFDQSQLVNALAAQLSLGAAAPSMAPNLLSLSLNGLSSSPMNTLAPSTPDLPGRGLLPGSNLNLLSSPQFLQQDLSMAAFNQVYGAPLRPAAPNGYSRLGSYGNAGSLNGLGAMVN